jgi:hypothetical protein
MEIVYSHSPELLAQYRELNAFMQSVARYVGVGSLPWLLKENNICGEAEMIEFISRPDHRHLLDAFPTPADSGFRSHTPRSRCVRFVFGVAAASRNTHFQAARYGLTWAGLAPADRASFGWRLLST